jgi:hypothetical protein
MAGMRFLLLLAASAASLHRAVAGSPINGRVLHFKPGVGGFTEEEKKSPFYAALPNCNEGYQKIEKKNTDLKAILCPMFLDEEGFLTEWIAYYKMMGFDHIMLFDDGSTDQSLRELQPWIDIGFVSVKTNLSFDSLGVAPHLRTHHFWATMAAKSLMETQCKLQAIEWGYQYFVSLDIDEYLFPLEPGVSVVDELHRVYNTTGRNSYCFSKHAFPAAPHILEPVDLLTIEAYQSRVHMASRMNYYTRTARKCSYPLYLRDTFTNITQRYAAECCRFHGCEVTDVRSNSTFCRDNHQERFRLEVKGKPWLEAFQINHYARSLEKFTLKQKTWHTSGGSTKNVRCLDSFLSFPHPLCLCLSVQESDYSISQFFSRSVGWHYDPSAVRYSCQVREIIRQVTKESVFYRRGDSWYRNVEFGKEVTDPSKRGRGGAPFPSGQLPLVGNPYRYERYQATAQDPPSQEQPDQGGLQITSPLPGAWQPEGSASVPGKGSSQTKPPSRSRRGPPSNPKVRSRTERFPSAN